MNQWKCAVLLCVMAAGMLLPASAGAAEWVDITKEVRSVDATKGGWGDAESSAKALRNADGTQIMIECTRGKFRIDCAAREMYKVDGDKESVVNGASLLNRQNGTMLVIKTSEFKMRVTFTEVVPGLKSLGGLTPQG